MRALSSVQAVRPNVNPVYSAAISARTASLVFGVVTGFLPVEDAPDYTTSGAAFPSTLARAFLIMKMRCTIRLS